MEKYLIIGGTGSLGKKLISRLSDIGDDVAVYSRDEAKHWTLRNELTKESTPKFFVGDIRDINRIKDVMRQYKPTTIIIAAALKQVDTCELSPAESLLTNVIGTQNVIQAVSEVGSGTALKKVLFVSTDKACAPVNAYGACKMLSERLVASQADSGNADITFLCTRYGNVLESRGSIIPLFKYQGEHCDSLSVTDPDMTRFVMTLDDSVDLILKALTMGRSGETWIPRIPAMRIGDLADIYSEIYNKPVNIIGVRPGEKKHEDLINESESVRTYETESKENYVIMPAYKPGNGKAFTYTSNDDVMTKEYLKQHLFNLGILNKPLNQFEGKRIEELIVKQ